MRCIDGSRAVFSGADRLGRRADCRARSTLRLAVTAIIAGTALGLVPALGEIAPVPLLGRLLETINMVLRSV